MLTLNSPQVVQETALRWKRDYKVSLVPTMGCLHEGHLALIKLAKQYGQKCVVSIFVNPLQFGPNEDFTRYPRTLESDVAKLEELGVDLLFHPEPDDLYPKGFTTRVQVAELARHMEGRSRPGHFDGVATVVLKLFAVTQPDFAIFGEKDFQQLRIVQQMTADLNLPITILPHPTVREADGLALSSRNRYLSESERRAAIRIPEAIRDVRYLASSRPHAKVSEVLDRARKILTSGPLAVDYVEVAPAATLVPADPEASLFDVTSPRLFLAARAGTTRLIDNAALASGEGDGGALA